MIEKGRTDPASLKPVTPGAGQARAWPHECGY